MKRLFRRLTSAQNLIYYAILIIAAGLLVFRLGTLVGNLRFAEVRVVSSQQSLHAMSADPIYLPWQAARTGVSYVAQHTTSPGLIYARLPSVILGLLTVALLYWLLRKWYGYRLAVFGTLLAVTSPWFLHLARLANPSITGALGMTALLCLVAAWHAKDRSKWLLYSSFMGVALLVYIPGFIWLVLGAALFERKNIVSSLKAFKTHAAASVVLGLVLLAPLIHSLIEHPHLYKSFIGLPARLPGVIVFAERLAQIGRYIFIGDRRVAAYTWVGLPMGDVLTTLAFINGVYLYAQHLKATRTRQLLYLLVVSMVLIALNGPFILSYLLPIVVVLSTGGIGYLLHLWLKVFPRNPIARGFGITLVGIVILFAIVYNLRNYYVAWPHNSNTTTVFQVKQ